MYDSIDRGVPGRSARREYERRSARREAELRGRYGRRIGGVVAVLGEEPAHTASWLKGAKGEEEAARLLERRLVGTGVLVLHDRRIPRSRANVDHIAIGPGGVTVIDPKDYAGRVRVVRRGGLFSARTDHLFVAGRDRTKLVDGVERQVEVVRAVVGDGVDVRGALCWLNAAALPFLARVAIRGVPVGGTKEIARLAARRGALAPDAVEALAARLAAALPPA